jgi:hypothetical protein
MISPNNQSAQAIKVGCSSKRVVKMWQEFFGTANFENTITPSIFVGISIMTTIWKSHDHSASNGIDLMEIWALCQKITALKLGCPQNMQ